MAETAVAGATIILDLGKRSRKQIKRLRRGEGKLAARIDETVAQLRADGELAEGDVVVAVVKQKPKSRFKLF
ncbi:MAG: hypothetical protein BGO95_02400 [Micrococcales bacterium 73-13]|nr:MAG: hypothetical protein BGO95_02400 [Micrococcales bacterium 73-13]